MDTVRSRHNTPNPRAHAVDSVCRVSRVSSFRTPHEKDVTMHEREGTLPAPKSFSFHDSSHAYAREEDARSGRYSKKEAGETAIEKSVYTTYALSPKLYAETTIMKQMLKTAFERITEQIHGFYANSITSGEVQITSYKGADSNANQDTAHPLYLYIAELSKNRRVSFITRKEERIILAIRFPLESRVAPQEDRKEFVGHLFDSRIGTVVRKELLEVVNACRISIRIGALCLSPVREVG